MKRELARQILSATLSWGGSQIEEYQEMLDDFSELKYDLYQQYHPGSRFVENFSIWLNQFDIPEREIAMNFILNNLIFVSPAEMQHLINTVYPDIITPILKQEALNIAKDESEPLGIEHIKRIFKIVERQSLFLALSDGARIDIFRRSNSHLSNEQICVSYELPDTKFDGILDEMAKDIDKLKTNITLAKYDTTKIKNIFLMDDFSGSGFSYIRYENEEAKWKGKIPKAIKMLIEQKVINIEDKQNNPRIFMIIYLMTEKAKSQIDENLPLYKEAYNNIDIDILYVQKVNPTKLSDEERKIFVKYYDPVSVETSHYNKGQSKEPYLGFNDCSLSLVIYHNTPNNSFPIIWAGNKALFPRITRHKDVD